MLNILLVDDEPEIRGLLEDQLRKHGHRVETAADYQLDSRLGCQCVVTGDVTVEIPAWNRNYISEGGTSILGDGIPPPKNKMAPGH